MNRMHPFPPPILWCDSCGQKRVTWTDRICASCHVDLEVQLARLLSDPETA